MVTKKERERCVKARNILVSVDQQCRQGGADLFTVTDVDPLERADGIEEARVMDRKPHTSQQATEEQDVRCERVTAGRRGHACLVPRSRARDSNMRVRSPRTASMSS